jgi:seryl-tRNA synthetase
LNKLLRIIGRNTEEITIEDMITKTSKSRQLTKSLLKLNHNSNNLNQKVKATALRTSPTQTQSTEASPKTKDTFSNTLMDLDSSSENLALAPPAPPSESTSRSTANRPTRMSLLRSRQSLIEPLLSAASMSSPVEKNQLLLPEQKSKLRKESQLVYNYYLNIAFLH